MDLADNAQIQEEANLKQALAASTRRVQGVQQFNSDGKVVCADCGDRIPQKRLRSLPDAIRCVDCQQDHERREARG